MALYGRNWFFDRHSAMMPAALFQKVFPGFKLMLACFLLALCVKQFDAMPRRSVACFNCGIVIVAPLITYFFLRRVGAGGDLIS